MVSLADRAADVLDGVLASVRDVIVVTDREGRIVAASRSAGHRLGAPHGLTGEQFAQYVDVTAADVVHEALQGDGLPRSFRVRPRRVDEDADVFTPLSAQGDTVVWRLDDSSAQRDELRPVATMIEGLTDAVVAVDPALVVTTANRAARRLFGAAVGEPLPDAWHGFGLTDFVRGLFERDALHGEALVEVEGSSYAVSGLPSAGKRLAIVFAVDATARTLRERLEYEFVANAAHELQTPLTAIVGLVEALSGEVPLDEDVTARFHAHLRRETQRLVRLIDAMLLLARVTATRPEHEPVEIEPLLRQIADAAVPAPGVEVVVDVPPQLVARSHHGLLEAVVTNLVQNAVRHTVEGRVGLTAHPVRGGIAIEVRDSGAGMDAATRARVFDRFYKGGVRSDGFGLGLAIAAQAAAALDAELELESQPGVGTVMRVVLPQIGVE